MNLPIHSLSGGGGVSRSARRRSAPEMEQGNGGEGRSGERSPHRQFPCSDTVMHNHSVGTCSDGAGYSRRKPGDWTHSGRRAGERPLNASFRGSGHTTHGKRHPSRTSSTAPVPSRRGMLLPAPGLCCRSVHALNPLRNSHNIHATGPAPSDLYFFPLLRPSSSRQAVKERLPLRIFHGIIHAAHRLDA